MTPRRRMIASCAAALVSLSTLAPAWSLQTDDPPALVAPSFEVVRVERGAFTAEIDATGRYTAAPLGEVKIDLSRYTGELLVSEVLVTHGRVSRGQPILKLDAPDLDEQRDDAEQSLARAEQKLRWAVQDAEIGEAELAQAAERRALEWADTLSDYERWRSFGKDDRYLQARLGMEQQESRLADEIQELEQLEELYDGARLASRTQDVVLERARRQLAVNRQMIEVTRRNHQARMEISLPRQERDWENRMRWLEVTHAHAERRAAVSRERQALALESAEEAVDKAREALRELEQDAESLVITAPEAGVLHPVTLKAGDKAQSKQAVASIDSATQGKLTMTVDASDLRVVQEGSEVEITWHAFGELTNAGTVTQIAWQGSAAGERQARYDVTVEVDNVASMIRPGMTATVRAARPLENQSLSLPIDAVGSDDDGAFVMVQAGDGFERRAVVTGASNGERVQILRGVEAGEQVRGPAE